MSQAYQVQLLQASAVANGNGTPQDMSGVTGAQQVEVSESAGGTGTIALQGSFDGTNWYACGYQQVDAITSLARSTANISVTANMRHVYQLLDPYPQVRAVLSAIAGSGNVTVKLYSVAA